MTTSFKEFLHKEEDLLELSLPKFARWMGKGDVVPPESSITVKDVLSLLGKLSDHFSGESTHVSCFGGALPTTRVTDLPKFMDRTTPIEFVNSGVKLYGLGYIAGNKTGHIEISAKHIKDIPVVKSTFKTIVPNTRAYRITWNKYFVEEVYEQLIKVMDPFFHGMSPEITDPDKKQEK